VAVFGLRGLRTRVLAESEFFTRLSIFRALKLPEPETFMAIEKGTVSDEKCDEVVVIARRFCDN